MRPLRLLVALGLAGAGLGAGSSAAGGIGALLVGHVRNTVRFPA